MNRKLLNSLLDSNSLVQMGEVPYGAQSFDPNILMIRTERFVTGSLNYVLGWYNSKTDTTAYDTTYTTLEEAKVMYEVTWEQYNIILEEVLKTCHPDSTDVCSKVHAIMADRRRYG